MKKVKESVQEKVVTEFHMSLKEWSTIEEAFNKASILARGISKGRNIFRIWIWLRKMHRVYIDCNDEYRRWINDRIRRKLQKLSCMAHSTWAIEGIQEHVVTVALSGT